MCQIKSSNEERFIRLLKIDWAEHSQDPLHDSFVNKQNVTPRI